MENLIGLLVTVIVLGIVFYIVWWFLGRMGLPEPFGKVAEAILALICVIILLGLLFGGIQVPTMRWLR
jgi:uncharacterized membrane protein YwzB